MQLKYKAYIKKLDWIVPVCRILFDEELVEVELSPAGDTAEYTFEEVKLLQYTQLKDINQEEIYMWDFIMFDDKKIGVVTYGEYTNACDDQQGSHVGFYIDWKDDFLKSTLRKDLGFWLKRYAKRGNVCTLMRDLKSKYKYNEETCTECNIYKDGWCSFSPSFIEGCKEGRAMVGCNECKININSSKGDCYEGL